MNLAATAQRRTIPPKPVPSPLAYSINDAAAASGLSRSTLYRHAAAGRLQMVLVGGRRLVVGASLRALVGAEA